jgi:uncharacterized protein
MRLDSGCGCAGLDAMADIWEAAEAGDLGEVERLVGQDPGLLDARGNRDMTPLMFASWEGHVGVVRWLVDKGVAVNQRDHSGRTALFYACMFRHAPVVRLLMTRGADPTIADNWGGSPLTTASKRCHLEVVPFLLGYSSVKATINHRDDEGKTGGMPATGAVGGR